VRAIRYTKTIANSLEFSQKKNQHGVEDVKERNSPIKYFPLSKINSRNKSS